VSSPYFIRKFINKTFAGRFMLSRLSHYGFVGKAIDHLLFKDDDILYLPRESCLPCATAARAAVSGDFCRT